MRFYKYLTETKHIPYSSHYLHYLELSNMIDEIRTTEDDNRFSSAIECDIKNVFQFVNDEYQRFNASLDWLDLKYEVKKGNIHFQTSLNKILNNMYALSKFVKINYDGFEIILRIHDKKTSYQIRGYYKHILKKHLNDLHILNRLIYRSGRLMLKSIKTEDKDKSDGYKFVRKTRKYWIHSTNLIPLQMYITKHLPVYVFQEKKKKNVDVYKSPYANWIYDTHDRCVSSVYFDNKNFDLYSRRIIKEQNAEIIRIRWYGNKDPELVFIERKRHKEGWTGETSKKLRFLMEEKHVLDYINGKNVWKHVKKINKGNVYTLYREIQTKIVNMRLRPIVRTFYKRNAYQFPNDSSTRISLDTNLCMIKESTDEDLHNSIFPIREWKRKDVGTNWPFGNLPKEEIIRFPYSVMEIKVQKHMVNNEKEWIRTLIDSFYLENVNKFSKFMHGCSILYFTCMKTVPYWLPQVQTNIRKEPYQPVKSAKILLRNKVTSIPSPENENDENEEYADHRRKKICMPKRIEPKLYFASERIFLKWIGFAVFLASIGTTLVISKINGKSFISGIVLLFLSTFFTFYGLYLYYWRNRMMESIDPVIYDDLYGPAIVVTTLIVGFCVVLSLKVIE